MFVHATAWMGHEKERKVCRQQVHSLAASAALQFATMSAWQFDNLEEQQLQRGCWTAILAGWPDNSLSWPLGMANRCGPPNPKTCNHQWTTHQLTNTLYRSASVDLFVSKSMDRVYDQGLSHTLNFEPQPNDSALDIRTWQRARASSSIMLDSMEPLSRIS